MVYGVEFIGYLQRNCFLWRDILLFVFRVLVHIQKHGGAVSSTRGGQACGDRPPTGVHQPLYHGSQAEEKFHFNRVRWLWCFLLLSILSTHANTQSRLDCDTEPWWFYRWGQVLYISTRTRRITNFCRVFCLSRSSQVWACILYWHYRRLMFCATVASRAVRMTMTCRLPPLKIPTTRSVGDIRGEQVP